MHNAKSEKMRKNIRIECWHFHKGITIKDYLVFDDKKCYDIQVNPEKEEMTIISTNWLNSYSGFTVTVSDTKL